MNRLHPWKAAAFWLLIYLALVAAPLLVLLFPPVPRGGGFQVDFALLTGYAAMAMMGMQFMLTARYKRPTAPFGIDIVYYFHRYLALSAFALIVVHLAMMGLVTPNLHGWFDPRHVSTGLLAGMLALAAFATIIISSIWRKQLRIEYDRWRFWHGIAASAGLLLAFWHMQASGRYLQTPFKRSVWSLLALCWLGSIAWVRLLRPWRLSRYPYRVSSVTRESGRSWVVTVQPRGHRGFVFRPGQFAWVTLRASPYALREHPFSIASAPAADGSLSFAIKELGDFTRSIGSLTEGEPAFVDGPYGAFCSDRYAAAEGFVFVAGGVGIAPIMSMLRAMAQSDERRPLLLFYGNRRWEHVVFRDELAALATRLPLRVVHVLGEPPTDWSGETGLLSGEILRRHLSAQCQRLQFLICGPNPMIALVERELGELGVSTRNLHSEIFELA